MMPGVEVDVRVEVAADEVVVFERRLLELARDLEERVVVRPSSRGPRRQNVLRMRARGS